MLCDLISLMHTDLWRELVMFIDDSGADLITTPCEFWRTYGNMPVTAEFQFGGLLTDEHDIPDEPVWFIYPMTPGFLFHSC